MYETLTLAALPVGESGYVTEISTRPTMEHRLMDLGLVRGTRVTWWKAQTCPACRKARRAIR